MATHQRYHNELQQRYLKFLQKEDAQLALASKQMEQQQLAQRRKAKAPVSSTLGRYIPSAFRVSTVLIDSAFRDTNQFPNANDFVVKLPEALRDVGAIRLLRTELYQPTNTVGFFIMNEVRVPLQLYNIESAYLYLNGYQSMQVTQELNTTFFARIGPGTELYPAVTGDIRQDPHMYTFLPAEQKLRRFHVKLLQADGSLYPVTNARVVLTLAVYGLAPGIPNS
jgi:hypothetical protein